ncbi:MAG: hypothetical protein J6A03_01730 [Lachnospiraceae bacterium]|nr:hypothetical protein [Lachnospiraceae bacterium]
MELNGFFDKVKKSSADAMDKAKDTTKRLMTVNDLKSKIRGYNNDKEKLFTQMGMDLYISKKQGEDIEEAIEAFVSQIDTLNVRVKNLQEKLELLESGDSVTVDDTEE